MQLIDTHCHFDDPKLLPQMDTILERCRKAGVTDIIVPGTTQTGWSHILKICEANQNLYPALGLHPMFMDNHLPEHFKALRDSVETGKLCAIGEVGLDYHIPHHKQQQQELLEVQLDIAQKAGLPVLLHVRKAHDHILSMIRRLQFTSGGIVHAYNGSRQQAETYMDHGFLFGFGGTLTYARAKKLHRLAENLPLENIVLETDAPFMAPASLHNQDNSPENLPLILKTLSELRSETMETIAYQTTANARRLLLSPKRDN